MVLKGVSAGDQPVITSPVYSYQADCGSPASCAMISVLFSVHLGSQIPATLMKVLDDAGNLYHGNAVPQLSFSCDKLHVAPANGQSARWHSPEPGVHQLQLPVLDIGPIAGQLTIPSSQSLTGVACSISVVLSGLSDRQGHLCQVSTTFTIAVIPGIYIAGWMNVVCSLAVLSPATCSIAVSSSDSACV